MAGFVEGMDRRQATLLPECLDDWVGENNAVRAVDVFVDALDLANLGFEGVQAAATGRPGYHPSVLLSRNLEVMWLTGRLAPDHKTIADFRKDNGPPIKKVCVQFVELCREMGCVRHQRL